MKTNEFIKQAENLIYKEIAKSTNRILGKNKTAGLSTGLFLKLPIEIDVRQVKEPLPKQLVSIESFLQRFSAYTKMGDTTKVYFTFMYHEEKELDKLLELFTRNEHSIFLGFVYIHELQHIIRKHITNSYNNMMLRHAGNLSDPHQAINIAEDHAINYSIKDLFTASGNKDLMNAWNMFEPTMCYKSEYHSKQMSDIDILKDMKSNATSITVTCLGNGFETVESDGSSSIQPTAEEMKGSGSGEDSDGEGSQGKVDKTDTMADDLDNSITDLAESIQDLISNQTKGTATGDLFEKLFDSIKVETGWFKKIKASFKRQVYYMTHDYTTSWANLNNTYRHIYKAPKKKFIDDKIHAILSVDHSGSVGTQELQKLLYLMESESRKIAKLTVLIHDTQIIKEFEIEDDFDIANSDQFNQALATRYTSGGTSHRCVFEHIQNMKIPDINKVIFMSFSDNYSDIDYEFNNFPIMRKLTNYWICTENNPVSVLGTNITMV